MFGPGPDTVTPCAFRGLPRWRRDGPPPDEDPRPEPPAWNRQDRLLAIMVGGMGCFPLLFLLAVYILAHTPMVAN